LLDLDRTRTERASNREKTMTTKNGVRWVVRGSVFAAAVLSALSVASSASARDEASGVTCVPDPGNLSAVTCTIGGGGGPSTFLGAFASDNGGNGGWVEFYSDDEGEWWVEHHANGDSQVGWDMGGPGASYINGPKFSSNKEGTYHDKKRPTLSGVKKTGPKRSYLAAKAAAAKQTAKLAGMTAAPVARVSSFGSFASLSLAGSGQCKAAFVVTKNGQFVSSTGIIPVAFPSTRSVLLPSAAGTYNVEVRGKDGCLNQNRSAAVAVQPLRALAVR
jgi:hypothetical protein